MMKNVQCDDWNDPILVHFCVCMFLTFVLSLIVRMCCRPGVSSALSFNVRNSMSRKSILKMNTHAYTINQSIYSQRKVHITILTHSSNQLSLITASIRRHQLHLEMYPFGHQVSDITSELMLLMHFTLFLQASLFADMFNPINPPSVHFLFFSFMMSLQPNQQKLMAILA